MESMDIVETVESVHTVWTVETSAAETGWSAESVEREESLRPLKTVESRSTVTVGMVELSETVGTVLSVEIGRVVGIPQTPGELVTTVDASSWVL